MPFKYLRGRLIYVLVALILILVLYPYLEKVSPGSFSTHAGGEYTDFLYFSFVTLTTLGYGDMAPLTAAARSLAVLEAITGVLFVATTIARLVGIHASQGPSSN